MPILIAMALLGATTWPGGLLAEEAVGEHSAMMNAYQAKRLIQAFAGQLQGELQAAMQQGGPVAAVAICQDRAPAIAASLSEEPGWKIGRTSLKPRNVANSPDLWERRVLRQFEDRAAAGADPQTLTYAEVGDGQGGRTYRFMKAIPTAPVCLACHGREISAQVTEALDQAYPQDQARGYQAGDLRGAFTLQKPL
jgi:hypothetical protein